jgi:hypothetical protein
MTPANRLTAEILLAVSKQFPDVKLWRNNRVDAMAVGAGGRMRRVKAGIDGQADLTGIIGGIQTGFRGCRLEIEVKAHKDRMRPSQVTFGAMIELHGGIYIEAREVEATLEELSRYARRVRPDRDHQEPGESFAGYTGI